jgi:hypothetical protein
MGIKTQNFTQFQKYKVNLVSKLKMLHFLRFCQNAGYREVCFYRCILSHLGKVVFLKYTVH